MRSDKLHPLIWNCSSPSRFAIGAHLMLSRVFVCPLSSHSHADHLAYGVRELIVRCACKSRDLQASTSQLILHLAAAHSYYSSLTTHAQGSSAANACRRLTGCHSCRFGDYRVLTTSADIFGILLATQGLHTLHVVYYVRYTTTKTIPQPTR